MTRFDCIWKQFENNFKNVDKSFDVLNIENHCSCGNCAVTKWNNWSTKIGPFDSMHCAKKSNICCVAAVSIDGCGKCKRSDNGTSCKLSQPTNITHSSMIWNVSVCLLKNSVNSLICWPRKRRETQNIFNLKVWYNQIWKAKKKWISFVGFYLRCV